MRIDNPTIQGDITLPATSSGHFSGSYEGDGSQLTGITATQLDIDAFGDDLTGNTLAGTDKLILSDGGTEGRVTVSQLATPLAGTGLEANAGTVRIAAAAAGDGLSGGAGSALAVNVDDSTIETNADTLRIKDAGVTNAKLANDSITFGATSQALGSTITTISGLTLISADTGTFVHQIFESASTIVTSGSNIFGDTETDNQIFTGSILQTGSITTNGIGVGTAPSGVVGAILATNDVVAFASSDERLKENLEPIGSAVDKVGQLTGYTYNWIPMEGVHVYGDMKDVGVIAQEVEKVLPEIVSDRENGYKAVKYDKLTALLIQAVKELSERVKELESK